MGHNYAGLIGFNPRRLMALKRDELPCNGPSAYAKSSSSSSLNIEFASYYKVAILAAVRDFSLYLRRF